MKVLIVFAIMFVALAAAVPNPHHEPGHETTPEHDAVKAQIKQYGDECAQLHNVSEEEREKLKGEEVDEPTENVKCFASCIMEKSGSLKDNTLQDDIITNVLTAYIGEEKAKQQVEKCKTLTNPNKCEHAYNLYKCFNVKHHEEHPDA